MAVLSDEVLTKIEHFAIKPGDLVVLKYGTDATQEEVGIVSTAIAAKFPEGVQCVVLPEGYEIEIHQLWRLVKRETTKVEYGK